MGRSGKYKSSLGFTDILFNLLLGYVFLFVLAFLLINPITKKQDAPKKAEFLIVIEWNEEYNDDVDLWVKDPAGNTVAFVDKQGGTMHLEKDDLGHVNDKVYDAETGEVTTIMINREVVTVRGITPGRYQIAAHIYNRGHKHSESPGTIRVTVMDLNPSYKEVYTGEINYHQQGQQLPLVNFHLDSDGNISKFDNLQSNIIIRGTTGIIHEQLQYTPPSETLIYPQGK